MRSVLVLMLVGCGGTDLVVTLSPESPTAATAIVAEVVEEDGDDISGLTLEYRWTLNDEPIEVDGGTLSVGQHVRGDVVGLDVVILDGEEESDPVSAEPVTIGNAAPVMGGVSITPRTPTSAEVLTAVPDARDPDGDPVTYTYTWYVDGEAAGTEETLQPPNASGSEITVEATPTDGTLSGATLRSPPVVTVNGAPPTPAPPTLSVTRAFVPSALSCSLDSEVSDPDGDPVTYEMSWILDGEPQQTVVATELDVDRAETRETGGVWSCRARALDDSGAASEWSEPSTPSDQTCSAEMVTLGGAYSATLAYTGDLSFNDTTLRAATTGDSAGDDLVGWIQFDLSGEGTLRGVLDATLDLHNSGQAGANEVVVLQTSARTWDPNAPDPEQLIRGEALTEPRGGFTPGERTRFPLAMDAWAEGPAPELTDLTLGVDNLAPNFAYAYFGSVKNASFAPRLELTVCR